jgi:hypothetical protein
MNLMLAASALTEKTLSIITRRQTNIPACAIFLKFPMSTFLIILNILSLHGRHATIKTTFRGEIYPLPHYVVILTHFRLNFNSFP